MSEKSSAAYDSSSGPQAVHGAPGDGMTRGATTGGSDPTAAYLREVEDLMLRGIGSGALGALSGDEVRALDALIEQVKRTKLERDDFEQRLHAYQQGEHG